MSIIKTHKVCLVTNNAEATLLSRHQGYARFAFNHALADFREGLDAGEWRGEKTLRPRFNAVKRTLAPWSASLSQNAGKYAILELGQAIERLWHIPEGGLGWEEGQAGWVSTFPQAHVGQWVPC